MDYEQIARGGGPLPQKNYIKMKMIKSVEKYITTRNNGTDKYNKNWLILKTRP